MTTIKKWLNQATVQVSRTDAEIILSNVLSERLKCEKVTIDGRPDERIFRLPPDKIKKQFDRAYLISHDDEELASNYREFADKLLMLRGQHVPLAYIFGYKEFYGHDFAVTPAVLIPRPESEDIIEIVKSRIKKNNYVFHPYILDVGTGSGCLAVTLAKELKKCIVLGTDISEDAIDIALGNAAEYFNAFKKNGEPAFDSNEYFQKKQILLFQHSDLLETQGEEPPDFIVANLPYVSKDWEWTSPDIAYEPKLALFAGNGGLALIFKLIDQIDSFWISKTETKYHGFKMKYPYILPTGEQIVPTGGHSLINGFSPKHYLVLEADPLQHEKIIDYAKKHHLTHLQTKGYILEFEY